jgi:hypothetical protein
MPNAHWPVSPPTSGPTRRSAHARPCRNCWRRGSRSPRPRGRRPRRVRPARSSTVSCTRTSAISASATSPRRSLTPPTRSGDRHRGLCPLRARVLRHLFYFFSVFLGFGLGLGLALGRDRQIDLRCRAASSIPTVEASDTRLITRTQDRETRRWTVPAESCRRRTDGRPSRRAWSVGRS